MDANCVILIIVIFIQSNVAIELECTFSDSTWDSVGKYCDFKTQPILPTWKDEAFEITGLTTSQKKEIKAIVFRTKDVAFFPKEAIQMFPNLERIAIYNTLLDKLTFELLENLLLTENNITIIDFYNNKFEMMRESNFNPVFASMVNIKLTMEMLRNSR
jgi:hypothetical protein